MKNSTTPQHTVRPPVIAVMGHIDHGKSTLLDHIRKENVTGSETGGITQHIAAYEITHTDQSGSARRITFLDTPGHEAFSLMRSRGAEVADIAILIVAADDGVKAQTKEALASIQSAGIPFVVAINKTDKPDANIEQTKHSLLEHEVYLEGLGGDVSWVPISAKTGEGIPDLLDILLLTADVAELSGTPGIPATGVVIESHIDAKKGISASLIIKDGTIKTGMCIMAPGSEGTAAIAPVRRIEDFRGEGVPEATFSSPVRITGFSSVPEVGAPFETYEKKKEAEKAEKERAKQPANNANSTRTSGAQSQGKEPASVPIVIKADVLGSIDAIEHELAKHATDAIAPNIISRGVGTITERDVKAASGSEGAVIVGFNVTADKPAHDLAERWNIQIATFDIIYKVAEWIEQIMQERKPRTTIEETIGTAKVLKVFSQDRTKQVLGCRIGEGVLKLHNEVKIVRRGSEMGTGTITNLQRQKTPVEHIEADSECGMQVNTRIEVARGDTIAAVEQKEV